MRSNRFYLFMMIFFVAGLGYLSYQIVKPFIAPMIWAIVLSIVFYPLYAFLLRLVKFKSLASLLSIFIIIGIILGPFSYFSFLLAVELKHLSDYLESGKLLVSLENVLKHPSFKYFVEKATEMLGYTEEELDRAIINSMSGLGKDFVISITAGIGNIVSGIVDFFFMTFAMFFLLRDGPQVLSRAHEYVPFPEEEVRKLDLRIRDIIVSTIYGGVAVGVIQGIIAGVTFYFLDIPSAALWGFATAVASFIPLLGAFTVWGPVMVYLFIKGFMAKGFILAFIGLFGISMIDNVLKPIIIGGRTKMPILVIFFSVLGGIQLFGLIGLIMGPLVLAIFVSVIEIFRRVEGGINT